MSQFLGEIRIFAGNFAPDGWAFCDGRLLAISEYDTLYSLIGTTYGGNGFSTFGLPDLRGRIPLHMGSYPGGISYEIGEMGGAEKITLTTQQLPAHSHRILASSNNGEQDFPANNTFPAKDPTGNNIYSDSTDDNTMFQTGSAGFSQPHDNMPSYTCVNFIIALIGTYPTLP